MKKVSLLSVILAAITLVLGLAVQVGAAVPQMLNYQGRLTDQGGTPLDTTVSINFTIYNDSIGGRPVWTETLAAVTVTGGSFNVLLGSISPIPDNVFAEPERYLGITIGSDPEISPRTRLVAVAYAHRVSTVDGSAGGTIDGSTYIGRLEVAEAIPSLEQGGDCVPNTPCPKYTIRTGNWNGKCGGLYVTDGNEDRIDLDGGSGDVSAFGKALFGESHSNDGMWSFVAGCNNIVNGDYSNVGGGQGNDASGDHSTISGGRDNKATAAWAVVAGGDSNRADTASFVGGGVGNWIRYNAKLSVIGGGIKNRIQGSLDPVRSAWCSTIGGGRTNRITHKYSTIGGGESNGVLGHFGTIGGGYFNRIYDAQYATIAGGGRPDQTDGNNNEVFANFGTIGGGGDNKVGASGQGPGSAQFAVISGGESNRASAAHATVGGGESNQATGINATVPGGLNNLATGDFSMAAGREARAANSGTFVWNDGTDGPFSSTDDNQFLIHAGGGVGIGCDDPSTALDIEGRIRIRGGGPATDYVLTADNATGIARWEDVENLVPGGSGTSDNDWELGHPNTDVLFTMGDWGIARKGAILYGTAVNTHVNLGVTSQTGTTGDIHYATVGGGISNVASGEGATVSGGGFNKAEGQLATICGGGGLQSIFGHRAEGDYSFVGGGYGNRAYSEGALVTGGRANQARGDYSTVAGGYYNYAGDPQGLGPYATVGGGANNRAWGKYSVVAGGGDHNNQHRNQALGEYSAILGGQHNTAENNRSTIGGGAFNMASDDYATIGGGSGNTAGPNTPGGGTTVGGGISNQAGGSSATVAGGYGNEAIGFYSTIAGGYVNVATMEHATVGGGDQNRAEADNSTVGGGEKNWVTAPSGTVAGGRRNRVTGGEATIGGGDKNEANGPGSTVGGGNENVVDGIYATIAGGWKNAAGGPRACVAGGWNNHADGEATGIGGGRLNTVTGSEAAIAGGYNNEVSGARSSILGGGNNVVIGHSSSIGGGAYNEVSGDYAVVSGGGGSLPHWPNKATGEYSSIAGGRGNIASGDGAAVGGGYADTASGDRSTVGGGTGNVAGGKNATVPGGYINAARGIASFAAGCLAKARHDGAVVISANDATHPSDSIHSGGPEQMVLRADGCFYLTNVQPPTNQGQATYDLTKFINTSTGAYLTTGGVWTNKSDMNLKENFRSVDGKEILEKILQLSITRWNYRSEEDNITHIGPVAQDFHALFGVGNDDKSISTIDPAGIALAAIQELQEQNNDLKTEIAELKALVQKLLVEHP